MGMVADVLDGLCMWMKDSLDIVANVIEHSALEWKVGLRKENANDGF